MAKVLKITMPEWLMKWVVTVSTADETTVSEFIRRSASDRCERRDREPLKGSGALRAAASLGRRGVVKSRFRRIAEALDRATETVGSVRVPGPARSQLASALEDLQTVTNLIFDQEAPNPGDIVNDNNPHS